jgi:hypothetical protein
VPRQPSQLPGPKDRSQAETESRLSERPSAFSESELAIPPGVTRGGDGVGTLIKRLVILHSDWSSGSRDSSVALHWSFLHSLSRRVIDLCRRLTSAFRAEPLVTFHCLRSRFLRRIAGCVFGGLILYSAPSGLPALPLVNQQGCGRGQVSGY